MAIKRYIQYSSALVIISDIRHHLIKSTINFLKNRYCKVKAILAVMVICLWIRSLGTWVDVTDLFQPYGTFSHQRGIDLALHGTSDHPLMNYACQVAFHAT